MSQFTMRRRDVLRAAAVPVVRILAQDAQLTVPRYVTPNISDPLPDPVRQGHTIWNPEPINYVVEERFMSGTAAIYTPLNMTDVITYAAGKEPPGYVESSKRHELGFASEHHDFALRPILSTGPYTTRLTIYRPRDMHRFKSRQLL